jgi:hypothetical protein
MAVQIINHTVVPRDFRLKPENIRASILELQAMIASIASQWNEAVFPVLENLDDKAYTQGIDGATLFIDIQATPEERGGLFWDIVNGQPAKIKDTINFLGIKFASLERRQDFLESNAATEVAAQATYSDTLLKNWIKQLAADMGTATFVDQPQGTEFDESFFTNSPTQTESNSLRDQAINIRSVIGSGVVPASTTISFSNTGYLNTVTTLHDGLVALDTGLKDVETEWEEDNGNIFRSDGNVGIGTATPSEKLHIDGTAAKLKITDPAYGGGITAFTASGSPHIYLKAHNDASGSISFRSGADDQKWAIATNAVVGDGLEFIDGSSTVVMNLAHGGNIGIGTTSPTKKLDVAGDINLTGQLSFDGSATVAAMIIDDDSLATASVKALASSECIKAYVDAQTLDFQGDAGGALDIILASQAFLFEGGLGCTTTGSNQKISCAVDATLGHVVSVGTLTSLTVSGTTTFNTVGYTWPNSDGSNGQVLSTNGAGVVDWEDASSGSTAFADLTDNSAVNPASGQVVVYNASGGVANGKVGSDGLSAGAVIETAIADDAVTSAKIAANAVDSSEIAEDAVGESELDPTAIPVFAGHAVSIYFASGDEVSIGDVVQLTQTGANGLEGRRHDKGSDPTAGAFGGMGIALEAGSGNAAIKVLIKGEASARIDQIPGVALSKGIKLIPSEAADGSLKKEGSPETGELVGWLLEDVTSGSSIVLKKIWVQPS